MAALATVPHAQFAPVQVQKMFFLIDENIAPHIGGKQFEFEPYDYGPFDKSVYQELEALRQIGLVDLELVAPGPGGRRYSTTPLGQQIGTDVVGTLPRNVVAYIHEVSAWVRSLNFAQLVGSIYRAYPQMRARSIFVE
ncbi:hypothetical protein [Phenylobacterium sp.]|uniref:hypothetical protein n=1 Tax=Phenylobacterium sp. TaxID=1871053 RepID=UPI0030033B5E